MNRRRRIWRPKGSWLRHIVSLHRNPVGPRDRELRLLCVEDEAGRLLSVIGGVPAIRQNGRKSRELSSDYPGFVRQALRAHLGGELSVLFLQGFCGDLR